MGATVRKDRERQLIHVETDNCIVNIYWGLHNIKGQEVTYVGIIPDNYLGEKVADVIGDRVIRVITRQEGHRKENTREGAGFI